MSRDPGRIPSVLLFVATLASVYVTYGFMWDGGNPFTDPGVAGRSAAFASSLMIILLAHEMGHYAVARAHGFRLSLPYFIPFPAGFGTLGALIRLRSPPPNRTALLEMGAAGPLAGAVCSFLALAVGLPLGGEVLEPDPGTTILVFSDPLAVKLVGTLLLGAPPDRYALLHPVGLAGWIGCLLTAINLLPIGQLDGGHIAAALVPGRARILSKVLLGLLVVGAVAWPGWGVWALVLLLLGAWRSLPVPVRPPLTPRSRRIALAAGAVFLLTFMPRPIQVEEVPGDPGGGSPTAPE
ncbi:MAG: site-2 protease family protein [Deltaproteobacteria bacterium]|nr:site-2 protease family protein [Deltaproteobacteria bacterium]